MKKFNLSFVFTLMIFLGAMFSSCQAIAGIFKAGVWFGVIGIVIVIVIIFWLISKATKK